MVRVWTAIVQWPEGDVEEVDVEAATRMAAQKQAETVLTVEYNPGWKIIDISVRPRGMSHLT